jgi:acyl-CoA synthetase (AMP-forming)/AMP-acid ligase II
MLSQLLFETSLPEARPAIVTPLASTTWGELREQAQAIFRGHGALAGRRVGVSLHASATSYALIAALDRMSCDVFLLDSRLPPEQANRIAEKMRLGVQIGAVDGGTNEFAVRELPEEAAWSGESTLTILTSGSTGEPKAARHTWESLSRPVRKSPTDHAPVWFLTYRPQLYAGLQVMLQCFADRGTLVVPFAEMEPTALAKFMAESAAQFVSATPSYWRRLLMFAGQELAKVPLLQITLGGEVVDQAILDSLRKHFPRTRVVHIYATTELGKCFSVNDGIAGFPATFLDGSLQDGCRLKESDGELLVSSKNSMRMYDPLAGQQIAATEWLATGDLIEIRAARVYFTGRKSEIINVAGSKVYPIEVERVIRGISGVSDVRVFGKSSSIAGELVACEIVAETGQDQEALKKIVLENCRNTLTSYQVPRMVKFVDHIDLSAAGKTLRSKTP